MERLAAIDPRIAYCAACLRLKNFQATDRFFGGFPGRASPATQDRKLIHDSGRARPLDASALFAGRAGAGAGPGRTRRWVAFDREQTGGVLGRGGRSDGGRPPMPRRWRWRGPGPPPRRHLPLCSSLGPCNHHGKRPPPCTEALIASGVARVRSCPSPDPDPARFRWRVAAVCAGRVVEGGHGGVRGPRPRRAHRGFLTRVTQGRPMLTLKACHLRGPGASPRDLAKPNGSPGPRRGAGCTRCARATMRCWWAPATARADDPSLTGGAVSGIRTASRCGGCLSRRTGPARGQRPDGATTRADRAGGAVAIGPDAPQACPARAGMRTGARRIEVAAGRRGGQLDLRRLIGGRWARRVLTRGVLQKAAAPWRRGLFGVGSWWNEIGGDLGRRWLMGAGRHPAVGGAMGIATLSEAPRFTLRATAFRWGRRAVDLVA